MKNKTKEIELLPCPFCGGEAAMHSVSTGTLYWVKCKKCEVCNSYNRKTAEGAAKLWNRRVKCKN